jgi:glycosyltransferase involved in cell wall biosynthesis
VTSDRSPTTQPVVALLPWGFTLEDFLEPHGMTLETFCREFRGSFMFGYVEALQTVGVRTLIVCFSRDETSISRRVHEPSGAGVLVLPVPWIYRALRRRMINPYGRSARSTFRLAGTGRALLPLAALSTQIAPFLSTSRRALARALSDEGCAAMLCQEYEFPRFDACASVSRRTGIGLFATFQGGNYRRWRLEQLTRPRAMSRCRGLIVASAEEARRVIETYGIAPGRIHPIPNPIDVSVWRPGDRSGARAKLGITPSARVAVWHGRTDIWKKGLDVLLEAWERLHDDSASEFRLVLIGDGPDAQNVSERIGRLRTPDVTFVNRLVHDSETLREYLLAGDVYVFPSRHEGFAIAPIEAMASGFRSSPPTIAGVEHGLAPSRERTVGSR